MDDARIVNGYAGQPGEGPRNQTCGSCCFSIPFNNGQAGAGAVRWYKCGHEFSPEWTPDRRTDVVYASPACQHWVISTRVDK